MGSLHAVRSGQAPVRGLAVSELHFGGKACPKCGPWMNVHAQAASAVGSEGARGLRRKRGPCSDLDQKWRLSFRDESECLLNGQAASVNK